MGSTPTVEELAKLSVDQLARMVLSKNAPGDTADDEVQITSVQIAEVDLTTSDDESYDAKPYDERDYATDCFQPECLYDDLGKRVEGCGLDMPVGVHMVLASLSKQSPAAVAKALVADNPDASREAPPGGDEGQDASLLPISDASHEAPPGGDEGQGGAKAALLASGATVLTPAIAEQSAVVVLDGSQEDASNDDDQPVSDFVEGNASKEGDEIEAGDQPPVKRPKTLHGRRRPADPVKAAKFDSELDAWHATLSCAKRTKMPSDARSADFDMKPAGAPCQKCVARGKKPLEEIFVEDRVPTGRAAAFLDSLPVQIHPAAKAELENSKLSIAGSYVLRAPCGSRVEVSFAKFYVRMDVSCAGYDRRAMLPRKTRTVKRSPEQSDENFWADISGYICDCQIGCMCPL